MTKSVKSRQKLGILLTIIFMFCLGLSTSYLMNYETVEGILQSEKEEIHETPNRMTEKLYKHIYTYTYDDEQITAITLDETKIKADVGEKIKVVYNVKNPLHSLPLEEYYYKIIRLAILDIILLLIILFLIGSELYDKWADRRTGTQTE